MSDVLRAPFTDNLYWWAPVDLLRRLLFVILMVAVPGNPVSVSTLLQNYLQLMFSTDCSAVIDYGLYDNICIP